MSRLARVLSFSVIAVLAVVCAQDADAQPDIRSRIVTIDYTNAGEPLWQYFEEAQQLFDDRIAGYRDDVPRALLDQLQGLRITVFFDEIDGPFNTLAQAAPVDIVSFGIVSPFFFSGNRPFAFARQGLMTVDIEDIDFMIAVDIFTEVIVHEAMHAIGFPNLFEQNGLMGTTNFFGDRNYNFDGFALNTYREESGFPFATYLSLNTTVCGEPAGDAAGGHWSEFDPFFVQPENGIQDVMCPCSGYLGTVTFYSETTWATFADCGYLVRKINAPGLPGQ